MKMLRFKPQVNSLYCSHSFTNSHADFEDFESDKYWCSETEPNYVACNPRKTLDVS